MTINDKQDRIIEEFELFDDWMDKYALLIEKGNALPPLDEKFKTENNLIEGCQSRVWLHAVYDGQTIVFLAESDAVIVKGLIALLLETLSGRAPQEIQTAELYFIDRIGLRDNLSPTRSNGLAAMLKQMKLYALAFMASAE